VARKHRTLSDKQRDALEARFAQVCFYGTPEKNYADSGLWHFINYVCTFDEHDEVRPIKKLPIWDKEYAQIILYTLLAHKMVILPKSRQILMSWLLAAFASWFVRTAPRRRLIWQSETETKAQKMVSLGRDAVGAGRIDHIEQHLPQWLQDPHVASGRGNKAGLLLYSPKPIDPFSGVKCPWYGSSISAVAQGARQVCGDTVSCYMGDEAAFQDLLEEAVGAILPAVKGGGRIILASSVFQGAFFTDMVLDGLDESGKAYDGTDWLTVGLLPDRKPLPNGQRFRINPSGYTVVETHYTADPAKDPSTKKGAAWLADYSKGYKGGMESSSWQTEMEINYEARGGTPIFPFAGNPQSPIYRDEHEVDWFIENCLIYAGYDFGQVNPAAFEVVGFDRTGDSWFIWELYEPCEDYVQHCRLIKACPYWDHIRYIVADPSIHTQKVWTAKGQQTVAALFGEEGVRMKPGRKGQDAVTAMRFKSIYWQDPNDPHAYLTRHVPGLRKELYRLRWALHRSQTTAAYRNQPEQIQQKDNHAWDAVSYLFDSRPKGMRDQLVEEVNPHSMAFARRMINEQKRRARQEQEHLRITA